MLVIRLLCRDSETATIDEQSLIEPVEIGRGSECAWRTPSDDLTIGRKHLKLIRKGRHVYVEAQDSLNGTFLNGKKIKNVRLKAGQRFIFGSCVLEVADKVSSSDDRSRATPSIKICSGQLAGKKIKLTKDRFNIGAGSDSDLFLMDDLIVSREHATIGIDSGRTFWIEDRNSRNGTQVNGESLAAGKRRQLKNGDVIQIAHVDIRFSDGSANKAVSRMAGSLLSVLITSLILWGGHQFYKHILTESAEVLLNKAHEEAKNENFDLVKILLEKARTASGYALVQENVQQIEHLLPEWKRTAMKWRHVEAVLIAEVSWLDGSALADQSFIKYLNELANTENRSWEWQKGGGWRLDVVRKARDLINVILRLESELSSESADNMEHLVKEGEAILNKVSVSHSESAEIRPQLQYIVGNCIRFVEEGQEHMAATMQLNDAWMNLEKYWPPHLREVRGVFEMCRQSRFASVSKKADGALESLVQLETFLGELSARANSARNLEFDEALNTIEIESVFSKASLSPVMSRMQENCRNSAGQLTKQVLRLRSDLELVEKQFMDIGGYDKLMRELSDPAVLKELESCSILQQRYPRFSRPEPLDNYDRILGVETFYAIVSDDQVEYDREWMPQLFLLKRTLDRLDEILFNFSDQKMAWLFGSGKAAERMRKLQSLAAFRERFVKERLDVSLAGEGREALVAAGMALMLVSDKKHELQLRTTVANRVKELKQGMDSRLGDARQRYEQTSVPEQKLALRKEILQIGVPGHPIVKKMWIESYN